MCLIKRKCDLNKVDYHDHSAHCVRLGLGPDGRLLLEEGLTEVRILEAKRVDVVRGLCLRAFD